MEESGSPRPKKVRPTQCAVEVMFIVAYAELGFFFGFSDKCEMCLKVVGGNNYIYYVIYK